MESKPIRKSKNRFEGIIVPSKWDNEGNIIGITLHTHDEKAYMIESSRTGNELFKYIRKNVLVLGKTRQRLDGHTLIRVTNYEVLNGPLEQMKSIA